MTRTWLAKLGLLAVLALGLAACEQQSDGMRSAAVGATSTPLVEPSPTLDEIIINGEGGYACGPRGTVFPNLGAERHFLAWTPDGTHLIFNFVSVDGRGLDESPYDNTAFWLVDAAGSRLDMIVDANPGHVSEYGHHADLSPDGTRLVYASCEYHFPPLKQNAERRDFDYEIAVVVLDGTGQQSLTKNTHMDHYPVWSPDGSRIAFLAAPLTLRFHKNDEELLELFTMARDGTDVRRVVPTGEYGLTLAPPVWSPDGERLAFLANTDHSVLLSRDLYTVRTDGTEMTLLAEEVVSIPDWSPDGVRLAVAKNAGDDVALFTLAPDGSDLERIITIATQDSLMWNSIYTVAWSPDGTQLLYSCDVDVCVVNVENGEVTAFDRGRGWPGPDFAAWSPDGTRIAIYMPANHYGGELVELYTVAPDGTDRRDLIRVDAENNLMPANPPEESQSVD